MSRKRSRLPYFNVGTGSANKSELRSSAIEASDLLSRGEVVWMNIAIPVPQVGIVGHSFLLRIKESKLFIADINGSDCYRNRKYNLYYKAFVDNIIANCDLDIKPQFFSGDDHDDAKVFASSTGPSDGGCSQYCDYLMGNNPRNLILFV